MTNEIKIQSALSKKKLRVASNGGNPSRTNLVISGVDGISFTGIELDENGIRDLVQWAIDAYGKGILEPKLKPVEPIHLSASEYNKQEFAKIPVGVTFTLGYHAYQVDQPYYPKQTEVLVKVSDTEYEFLDKSWSTKSHHIRGWSIWYRTFTWTDNRTPEQVIIDHNIAEFAKLPIGASFEATAIGEVSRHLRPVVTGKKITDSQYTYEREYLGTVTVDIRSRNAVKRTWVETTPSVAEQLKKLAVGDQYTITFNSGLTRKGVRVSDKQVYEYDRARLLNIEDFSTAGESATVTKENA